MSDIAFFVIGLILGGATFSVVTILLMTWWAKDDWLEGYKSGLDNGISLVKRIQK